MSEARKYPKRKKNCYATIDGVPVFTTYELCGVIGVHSVSTALIQELGFDPAHKVGNAFYWKQSDVVAIAQELAIRIVKNARIHQELPF